MPEYTFTAVDAQGHATADRLSAANPAEARARLAERGLVVRSLEADRTEDAPLRERIARVLWSAAPGGVRSEEIARFYESLAVQLDAGIDIRRAVSTLADQHRLTAPALGRHLAQVRDRLADGESLGDAMARHPALFGEADVRAIEAAERAGVLEESLHRLAAMREATVRLRKQAISALSYPAAVLAIATVITLLLFLFVVPIILAPIVEEGHALPLPTRIVATASNVLIYGWWVLILLAVGGWFLGRKLRATKEGRRTFDSITLAVPVIGPMLRKHALAQAATLLGTTVRCGLNFIEGLDLTARAARNEVVRAGLERWRDEIAAGREVDDALVRAGGFPPLMLEMVSVGATGGKLDAMLAKLAETYETDVAETARRLGALVGPALTLILGGVVLLIALAILLPILQLGDVFAP